MKWKVRSSVLQCLHPLLITACYCSSTRDLLQSFLHSKLLLLLSQPQFPAHQRRKIFCARWTAAISQSSSPSPYLFAMLGEPSCFPTIQNPHSLNYTLTLTSCSARSVWEPRSANYGTSPGTLIYLLWGKYRSYGHFWSAAFFERR